MPPPLRLSLLVLLLPACSPSPSPSSSLSPVVHDVDDRLDFYELTSPSLADQARGSVVALVHNTRLAWNGNSYDIVGVSNLDERQNLCPDEAFADQPTVASCSGALIDDDLVLTAGHCILPQGAFGTAGCTTTRFVFDFLMTDPTTLDSIDAEDVYRCRSVLAHRWDESVDYAIVQLDRPVVGRSPAAVRRMDGPLAIGAPLVEIGFPTGMPMKIDPGGKVLDPGPPDLAYFVSDLDSFRGNSGSSVRDESGAIVGIVARTMVADYVYDPASRCYRTSVLSSSRGAIASTYADSSLVDLCDTQGYPSEALCGIAPSCGDLFCTSGETTSCPGDCAGSICGDGICETGDTAASCPYDCGATVAWGTSEGCAVDQGTSPSWLVLLVPLALLLRRRRVLLLLALCAALSASSARAQPRIHPWGLRFVGALETGHGRAMFWNPQEQFGTLRESGMGLGARLGADMGLGRYAAVEATVGGQLVGGLGVAAVDLAVAPRFRMLLRPRHDLYLRAPIGASHQFDPYGDPTRSFLVGGGVGYRWQLTRVVDAFVEIDLVGRFGGAVDPYYAYLEGYGLHPSSPPHLRTTTLGFRLGIGLGRGYRPSCATP